MIVIVPTAATINAATKPYVAAFLANMNFAPIRYVWYANGILVGSGYSGEYQPDGSYNVSGPLVEFSGAPTVISVTATHADGTTETDTIVTAEQRPAPSFALSLLEQKNGVLLQDDTIPESPTAVGAPGENRVVVLVTREAPGETPRADVVLDLHAEDEIHGIEEIYIDWGDGHTDMLESAGPAYIGEPRHTYLGVAGPVTVSSYYVGTGAYTGSAQIVDLVLPPDVSGWRANQFRVIQYQDQLGFRELNCPSWTDFTGSPVSYSLYNRRRGHVWNFQLQLRETDTTGRPLRTSLRSVPGSVGPWA